MARGYRRYPKKGMKKPPKRKITYRGIRMASQSERKFAIEMDEKNIPWMYEPDKWDWIPPRRKYTVDFKILRPDGTYFYVEYKGYFRPEDKTKMAAIKKQYPHLDIRFVFADANKPVGGAQPRKDGTKQTNKQWAEKNGYLWAEGFIPEKWLTSKDYQGMNDTFANKVLR